MSARTVESSFPVRALPLPVPSVGRTAMLPALPIHAFLAGPRIPPRSDKTTGSLRQVPAYPVPRMPFEIPPSTFGYFPCLRTPPPIARRASAPAPLRRSLVPPRESSATQHWKTLHQIRRRIEAPSHPTLQIAAPEISFSLAQSFPPIGPLPGFLRLFRQFPLSTLPYRSPNPECARPRSAPADPPIP